jgi:hypothetical protein
LKFVDPSAYEGKNAAIPKTIAVVQNCAQTILLITPDKVKLVSKDPNEVDSRHGREQIPFFAFSQLSVIRVFGSD